MNVSLIQFSVQNYRSFKDLITFSMETGRSKGKTQLQHFFQAGKKSHSVYVAKSAFLFWANASGKTNLLSALEYMDYKVSLSHDIDKLRPQDPFLLNINSVNEPSFFEIIFSLDDEIFQYNFKILKDNIVSENLYKILTNKKSDPVQLLKREWQKIEVFEEMNTQNTRDIIDSGKTREEALFISVAQNWNEDLSRKIGSFFREYLYSFKMMDSKLEHYTKDRSQKDEKFRDKIVSYLQKFDFSISWMRVEEREIPRNIDPEIPNYVLRNIFARLELEHKIFDDNWNHIDSVFFSEKRESLGTQNFLKILGPIFHTLENWWILLIDEFNASLHPKMCDAIIELILRESWMNGKNSQFIFTTHDTNILDNKLLKKDQFWFTERKSTGASDLYSLGDFDIREDTKGFSVKYKQWRFWAIPFISL